MGLCLRSELNRSANRRSMELARTPRALFTPET